MRTKLPSAVCVVPFSYNVSSGLFDWGGSTCVWRGGDVDWKEEKAVIDIAKKDLKT